MQSQPLAPASLEERLASAERIHRKKNDAYADIVARGQFPLRAGGARADAGLRTRRRAPRHRDHDRPRQCRGAPGRASGTGLAVDIRRRDLRRAGAAKETDPQAYLLALKALGLRPHEAVAMEDAPAGVAAARAAGIPVIVTRSHYFPDSPAWGLWPSAPRWAAARAGIPPRTRPRTHFPGANHSLALPRPRAHPVPPRPLKMGLPWGDAGSATIAAHS